MFDSGVPKCFWGECLLMATYLIDRLPSKIIKWKSPYEKMYNRLPDYASLKSFGCMVFYTNISPHKDKFDVRGTKGVFTGYSLGQKGFKIYDLENKTIIVSRDVRFYESTFPFLSTPDEGPEIQTIVPLDMGSDGCDVDEESSDTTFLSTPSSSHPSLSVPDLISSGNIGLGSASNLR